MKRRTFECIWGATSRELSCLFDFRTSKYSFKSNLKEFCPREAILVEALEYLLLGIFLTSAELRHVQNKSSLELLHKSISKWIFPKGFLLLISILAF